ncbi:hypothetical protein ACFQ60_22305 [Streptomyces zhihengii]|uniref:Integral membrane protein n=1 Tax=Streptomyces zhihengii TaxID=1818004 RepID=A0ABS2UUB5_9ACTN|nr:hypothetical protein [Streptomyces zhihengii]MBM9621040.1 hypothetical protein [Streptomyces zhihengii]
MATSLYVSVMRTVVPLVAGWLITTGARAGLELDGERTVTLVLAGCTAVYYVVFRCLEIAGQRARGTALQTVAGLFLGWARPPEYPAKPALPPVTGDAYRGQANG